MGLAEISSQTTMMKRLGLLFCWLALAQSSTTTSKTNTNNNQGSTAARNPLLVDNPAHADTQHRNVQLATHTVGGEHSSYMHLRGATSDERPHIQTKKGGGYSVTEGKGGKASKKGSKASKASKKSKKAKGSKKHGYKLKHSSYSGSSSDKRGDDMQDDYYMDDDFHFTDDFFVVDPMDGGSMPPTTTMDAGASMPPTTTPVDGASMSPTAVAVAPVQRTGSGEDPVELSGTEDAGQENGHLHFSFEALTPESNTTTDGVAQEGQQIRQGDIGSEAATTTVQQTAFKFPMITRTLFPTKISLKAHSNIDLEDRDGDIFSILQGLMTPFLQENIGSTLQSYQLGVVYKDGVNPSSVDVIVTEMNVTVVLAVTDESIETVRTVTHDSATATLLKFFQGHQLYEFLGEMRRQNIMVNEIVFLDQEFRSPIFSSDTVASVQSTTTRRAPPPPKKKSSKAGLISALFVGMFVVVAVFFAHRRGRLPELHVDTARFQQASKSLGRSIRKTGSSLGQSIRNSLSRSFSSDSGSYVSGSDKGKSDSGSSSQSDQSEIKKAALQTKPAFSEEYLKRDSADEQSCVSGDFDIPEEYEFHTSPMLASLYSGRNTQKTKSNDDEFSMPDDYNTVNEENSLYSRNISVKGYRPKKFHSPMGRTNPFDHSPPSSRQRSPRRGHSNYVGSPNTRMSSPGYSANRMASPAASGDKFMDEWSMDSYETPQTAKNPPYRHWKNEEVDPPTPESQLLNLPHLT